MIYKTIALALLYCFVPLQAMSEMKPLDDENLDNINGQGGVYLTGEFTINKDGGPLWGATAGQLDPKGGTKITRNCGDAVTPTKECGMRIAVLVDQAAGGWYVFDDVSGGFSFEGLTLRTEYIDKDEEGNDFKKEVLKIGLPDKVKMNNYKFSVAASNSGQWSSDAGFKQTNIFGVQQHGEVTLKGNLLMFPID